MKRSIVVFSIFGFMSKISECINQLNDGKLFAISVFLCCYCFDFSGSMFSLRYMRDGSQVFKFMIIL